MAVKPRVLLLKMSVMQTFSSCPRDIYVLVGLKSALNMTNKRTRKSVGAHEISVLTQVLIENVNFEIVCPCGPLD